MLVVARYGEDVAWTEKYPTKIIYNKGTRDTIPASLHDCVQDLPNVGREAHTFLWYIVSNYDNLDDIVAFVQGNSSDHLKCGWSIDDLLALEGDYSMNLSDSKFWGCYASSYGFRIRHWAGANLAPSKYDECYGKWYERVVGVSFPHDHTLVYEGAVFSVRRDVILKHPKELYERLLEETTHANAPESAHFLERTWSKLFCPNQPPLDTALLSKCEGGIMTTRRHCDQVDGLCHDLRLYVSRPCVKRMLEVGFGAGHSSYVFLSHNKQVNVVSFDLEANMGKMRIDAYFPDRHQLVLGNTQDTLPKYVNEHPGEKFDLIFIDGSTDVFQTVCTDLKWCIQLAHESTVILMNNVMYHPQLTDNSTILPTLAWTQVIKLGAVKETHHHMYSHGRGMAHGKLAR